MISIDINYNMTSIDINYNMISIDVMLYNPLI